MIKISKVCKEFNICRQTIYNWSKKGKIELIKSPGGHYFISNDTYNFLLKGKNKKKEDGIQR